MPIQYQPSVTLDLIKVVHPCFTVNTWSALGLLLGQGQDVVAYYHDKEAELSWQQEMFCLFPEVLPQVAAASENGVSLISPG